mgnify:CR=1 FL=1
MGVPVRAKRTPAGKRFAARATWGERVFNVLGLIEHRTGKVLLGVLVDIAPHKVIRRHDHVMLGHAGNLYATLRLGAHDGAHIERGRKALQLGSPVVHE